MPRLLPSERLLNRALSQLHDREVVQFEIREISSGNLIRLRFESHDSPWREGVWLATDGLLRANEVEASQLLMWTDTAPGVTDIEVVSTDGLLRLCNLAIE